MKKVTIVLAAFLLAGTISFGQSSTQLPVVGQKATQFEQKANDEYKSLNLSADQQSKINAIKSDVMTKMTSVKNNTSLTQSQKQQQMQALMQSGQTKINAVLTPDQQAQLKNKAKGAIQSRFSGQH
jgi:Spy/CpxP family protein refolding chaperone